MELFALDDSCLQQLQYSCYLRDTCETLKKVLLRWAISPRSWFTRTWRLYVVNGWLHVDSVVAHRYDETILLWRSNSTGIELQLQTLCSWRVFKRLRMRCNLANEPGFFFASFKVHANGQSCLTLESLCLNNWQLPKWLDCWYMSSSHRYYKLRLAFGRHWRCCWNLHWHTESIGLDFLTKWTKQQVCHQRRRQQHWWLSKSHEYTTIPPLPVHLLLPLPYNPFCRWHSLTITDHSLFQPFITSREYLYTLASAFQIIAWLRFLLLSVQLLSMYGIENTLTTWMLERWLL